MVIVDASAKFLRVALEKYQDDPLVALRLLRYLRDEGRLQTLDEVLDVEVDALAARTRSTSTPTSSDTLARWMRALRPGGGVFINSGNIRNPRAKPAEWILDETVWVINDLAEGLVRSDPHYVHYRDALDDAERMRRTPTTATACSCRRGRSTPTSARWSAAGFEVLDVREETIEAA